jgi:membrane protein
MLFSEGNIMPQKNKYFYKITTSLKRIQNHILSVRFIRFMMRVIQEMGDDNGTNMAASVAYYAFLSLFPLLLGLIGFLGLILPSQSVQNQIFSYIQNNLPGARDIIENNIRQVIQLRGALGIIGIIGLLWSGSTLMSTLGSAINLAWDIPRQIPFYLQKLRDIGLTIGLGILFFISLASSAILNFIPVGSIPIVGSYFVQLFLRIVAFALAFVIFLILFKVMPNTKSYWRHIWPGALFTAVLFEIGRVIFLYYINNFTNYQAVYGTIGSVIALLVWIYYSAVMVIIGAEFTAEYSRLRRGIGKGTRSHSMAKP